MATLEQQLHPHRDVVDTELEGQESVLLHLQSKLYYTLNVTGTHIWRGLRKDLTLREISQCLQREFIVDAEAADQCVLRLVDELCRQKLVETLDVKEFVERPL